jgi:hypothetical protein
MTLQNPAEALALQASFGCVRGRSRGSGPRKDRSEGRKGPQDRKVVGLRIFADHVPGGLDRPIPSKDATAVSHVIGSLREVRRRAESVGSASTDGSVEWLSPHATTAGG